MAGSSETDWWHEFIAYCGGRPPTRALALEFVERIANSGQSDGKGIAYVLATLHKQLTMGVQSGRHVPNEKRSGEPVAERPEDDDAAPLTRAPRLHFPFRKDSVVFGADCNDQERTWTLLVESAGRGFALRLTRRYHSERETLGLAYVALTEHAISVMGDARVDAKILAQYLIDIVMAGSSEKMSADCVLLLRTRLCEAIGVHRQRIDAGLA